METINNQVAITTQEELAIIKAKEEAAFALTPVGQYQIRTIDVCPDMIAAWIKAAELRKSHRVG